MLILYYNGENMEYISEIEKEIERKQFRNVLSRPYIYNKRMSKGTNPKIVFENILGLSKRDTLVLKKRFGIGFKTDCTLSYIGKKLNVSKQGILSIEYRALMKLRQPRQKRILLKYITL